MQPALKQPDCFGVWRLSPTDRLAGGAIISGSTAPVVCLLQYFFFFFPLHLTSEALNPSGLSQHPASCLHVASVRAFDSSVKHIVGNRTFSSNATFIVWLTSCCSFNLHSSRSVTHAFFSPPFLLWRGNCRMWQVSVIIWRLITTVDR